MIEEFSGVCSEVMNTLLDVYQMKDWEMSWVQFLEQFTCEMLDTIGEWQTEAIKKEQEEEGEEV